MGFKNRESPKRGFPKFKVLKFLRRKHEVFKVSKYKRKIEFD